MNSFTLHISIAVKPGFDPDTLADIDMLTEDIAHGTFDAVIDGEIVRPGVLTDTHNDLHARGMGRSTVFILISSDKRFLAASQVADRRVVMQDLFYETFPAERFVISFGTSLDLDDIVEVEKWMMEDEHREALIVSMQEQLTWAGSVRRFGVRAVYDNLSDIDAQHRFMAKRSAGVLAPNVAGATTVADLGAARLRRLPEEQQANAMAGLLGQPRIPEMASAIANGRGSDPAFDVSSQPPTGEPKDRWAEDRYRDN